MAPWRWRWVGIVAAAGIAATPEPAWGAGPEAPKALLREGAERFKAHDYEAARAAFARAYVLDAAAGTLLNLALAELHADRPLEAVRHFREYLQTPGESLEKIEAVRTKWLPRAEAQIGELRVVAPAGAEIAVDGQPAPLDPSTGVTEVTIGDHVVHVHAGERDALEPVQVKAAERVTIALLMDDVAPAPAVALVPSAPNDAPRPPAGKVATVSGLGIGGLALAGLGVGFALTSQQDGSHVSALRASLGATCGGASPASACTQVTHDESIQRRDAELATALYVGAGVLGVAALSTWVLWPTPSRPSAAGTRALQLLPTAGDRRAGCVLRGTW
jgi:hypothetical protein